VLLFLGVRRVDLPQIICLVIEQKRRRSPKVGGRYIDRFLFLALFSSPPRQIEQLPVSPFPFSPGGAWKSMSTSMVILHSLSIAR